MLNALRHQRSEQRLLKNHQKSLRSAQRLAASEIRAEDGLRVHLRAEWSAQRLAASEIRAGDDEHKTYLMFACAQRLAASEIRAVGFQSHSIND